MSLHHHRALSLCIVLMLIPQISAAHPSRGIVASNEGQVFFSDLERVWAIDPRGRLTLVRPKIGVHTHELFLGPDGVLYAENSYYEAGRYSSALWRRDRDGRVRFIFGPAAHPPAGLGVVRDRQNCTYQADETTAHDLILYKRCPQRPPRKLAGVASIARDLLSNRGGATYHDNNFYFRRGPVVYKVNSANAVSIAARGLSRENFGIAVEPSGAVLAAEFAYRRVVRVDARGRRTIISTSERPWAPTGVAATPAAYYVLEVTSPELPQRMRVRRITGGRSTTLATVR